MRGDNYNPYSIIINDKVVANVSVNKTDMIFHGTVRHFLQLGTVMTDEAYRNQGLIRKIMERIDRDYSQKTDGIYLFANDNVLEFYPRFGFQKSVEYLYSKNVSCTEESCLGKLIMDQPKNWELLITAIERNIFYGRLDMVNNLELIMFYVTKYMQENVYYHKDTDTYIIAEVENENLFIHNVFSSKITDLDTVINFFGKEIKYVTLGFTPVETKDFHVTEYHEDDCTFFIKGKNLEIIEKEHLRIPSLAHA